MESLQPAHGQQSRTFFSKGYQLRLLAKSRRIMLSVVPLGVVVGVLVTLALLGLDFIYRGAAGWGETHHLEVALPVVGLGLAALLLHWTRLENASLAADLALSHDDPYAAFPFRKSLTKVLACAFTIGLGGSAGVEGPSKWFGAAVGIQFHRILKAMSKKVRPVRHFLVDPRVLVTAGAAAALATVFRAPIAGALLAAEHEGHLTHEAQVPALVAAGSGYLVFVLTWGPRPLFPMLHAYKLEAGDIPWALILGFACGLGCRFYRRTREALRGPLERLPMAWRGVVGGLGLVGLGLLVLPLSGGPVFTQGGGLNIIRTSLATPFHVGPGLGIFALKLLATALTFAAGGLGGQWMPMLAMGAALGSALEGPLGAPPGLMAMVGASAFAGAHNRTLLVPAVFLAETTGQAGLVVPALLATIVAFLVVGD